MLLKSQIEDSSKETSRLAEEENKRLRQEIEERLRQEIEELRRERKRKEKEMETEMVRLDEWKEEVTITLIRF